MDSEEQRKTFKQQKALKRLLQVDDKKTISHDHWHQPKDANNIKYKFPEKQMMQQTSSRKDFRISKKAQAKQKSLQKQRLKQLLNEHYSNQQPQTNHKKSAYPPSKQNGWNINCKLLKNARLRAFNSNITFYSLGKEKLVSSSMTYYDKSKINPESTQDNFSKFMSPSEVIKKKYNSPRKDQEQSSGIVFFRPNKSQTIRQLLNKIDCAKSKNKEIVLNSVHQPQNSNVLQFQRPSNINHSQLKMMSRYSNFMPFRQDQSLLLRKIVEADNVWKQKFRESWHRQKKGYENRRTYFKKLIVKD